MGQNANTGSFAEVLNSNLRQTRHGATPSFVQANINAMAEVQQHEALHGKVA